MQSVIGLTANINETHIILNRDLCGSISKSGGIALTIAYTEEIQEIKQICQMIDGLLLTGGVDDVDPSWYGEEPIHGLGDVFPERDRMEMLLTREMLNINRPIFAICRGCQVLNVAAGGSLYQDINTQCNTIQHRQKAQRSHLSHYVQIEENTLLHKIVGVQKLKVNSFHHQAVKNLAPDFKMIAKTSDGIIEAYESIVHRFVLGVQWHPENCYATDEFSRKLFHAFVESCK